VFSIKFADRLSAGLAASWLIALEVIFHKETLHVMQNVRQRLHSMYRPAGGVPGISRDGKFVFNVGSARFFRSQSRSWTGSGRSIRL
jgi:hypothetical protein